MVANRDKIYDRWPELKDQLKRRWSKLTEDDCAKPNCTQEKLVWALRRRYGYAEGQAVMEIDHWLADLDRKHPAASKR